MGLDVLLRAWAEVVHRLDTPVQLVLVGDGSERANLESLARSLGLADAVRFLGRVDDSVLADCYRAADVSVVPTVALEGFGLVVLESLACGTPVIGTSAGGLPEVLAPLSGDLVVASGDTEALAVRLADAADGRRPLPSPADCRSYAEAFDWPRVAERHVTLYAAVSADRRRRAADRPSLASLPRIAGVRSRPASRPSGRRLRVVVLGHTAQLSGGELAMSRLLPALDDVDVEVLLGEDGPLLQSLEALAVPVDVFPLPRRWSQTRREAVRPSPDLLLTAASGGAFVMALARHLRRLRPDLVHTNTLKAALYGGLACRLAGIPCLWHIRDRIEPDYLPGPAVRLVRSAARVLPRYVVANSESTLATLRLPPRHGEAIPSPVDLAAFRDLPLPAERPEAGGLRIGMVGRISPWKGQDLFLRAFAQAFREGPEQAVIVGAPLFAEEPFADHLEQVVAELGLADRVEFRGFRKDIPQELGRLDVLVHASVTPEPFGQVVVEGMSAGLPVVAAGAGGPAEIITNGIDGLLFSPGDVDSLAALLQQLGRSPSRRRDLGLQGRRTAEAYCPTVVARRVLDVYHRVAP
jgi:glycosyltransferase involved in cell wall biosynthesis